MNFAIVVAYDAIEDTNLMFTHVINVIISMHIIITNAIFAIADVDSVISFKIFVVVCVKDVSVSLICRNAGVIF